MGLGSLAIHANFLKMMHLLITITFYSISRTAFGRVFHATIFTCFFLPWAIMELMLELWLVCAKLLVDSNVAWKLWALLIASTNVNFSSLQAI
jgi:hypothetical protein